MLTLKKKKDLLDPQRTCKITIIECINASNRMEKIHQQSNKNFYKLRKILCYDDLMTSSISSRETDRLVALPTTSAQYNPPKQKIIKANHISVMRYRDKETQWEHKNVY